MRDVYRRQQQLNELRQRLEEEQFDLIGRLKVATDLKRIRMEKALLHTSALSALTCVDP